MQKSFIVKFNGTTIDHILVKNLAAAKKYVKANYTNDGAGCTIIEVPRN